MIWNLTPEWGIFPMGLLKMKQSAGKTADWRLLTEAAAHRVLTADAAGIIVKGRTENAADAAGGDQPDQEAPWAVPDPPVPPGLWDPEVSPETPDQEVLSDRQGRRDL